MRKFRLFPLTLIAFLSFLSCQGRYEFIGDEYSEETTRLREQYNKFMYGSWTYTDSSSTSYLHQRYRFNDNGTFNGHVTKRSRDSVLVNGHMTLTDWKTFVDEDVTGEWSLIHIADQQRDVLFVNSGHIYIGNKFLEFITVNDSILKVGSPFLYKKTIKMNRTASN